MEKENTEYHLLTSLDDIDWLLNVRGQDVEYFPLLLSYALITMDSVELYADERKFDENILSILRSVRYICIHTMQSMKM